MKILSLDPSTSTGWSLFDKLTLLGYGTLDKVETKDYKQEIRSWKDYPDSYPNNLMQTAGEVARMCGGLYDKHSPDLVIIEEINKGRSRISQKLLCFIQMAIIDILQSKGAEIKFLTTDCWRGITNTRSTKEDRNFNAKIARLKKKRKGDLDKQIKAKEITKADAAKINKLPAKIDGKVVGKRGTKDYALRRVKDIFGLEMKKKENDAAEALLIGVAGLVAYCGEALPESLS